MVLAIEGCKSALERKDLTHHEAVILSAGVVTLYASPFTEGCELGKLEEKYEKFINEDFKNTHEAVIVYRNCFIAHRDLSNDEVKVHLNGITAPFFTPIITVLDDDRHKRHVPFMFLSSVQFERIKALAEFQLKRLSEKATKLFDQLVDKNKKDAR